MPVLQFLTILLRLAKVRIGLTLLDLVSQQRQISVAEGKSIDLIVALNQLLHLLHIFDFELSNVVFFASDVLFVLRQVLIVQLFLHLVEAVLDLVDI